MLHRTYILRITAIGLTALGIGFCLATLRASSPAALQSSSAPSADQIFAPGSLIEPAQLAQTLSQEKEKPAVVCVGFKVLYEGAHIRNALYLGPARTDEGLDTLHKWAESLPRNKAVVIYCGCCPWEKCPNIRPAYALLQKMGFTKIQVLHVSQDLAKDWVAKGLPTDREATAVDPSSQKTN